MKTLYFDLIGGISGDMTVGALLDLGVSFSTLKKELAKVAVRGYALKRRAVKRGHGRAVKFDVQILRPANVAYPAIVRLINNSRISRGARDLALRIYEVLKGAETRVHGHAHEGMRFEQVGDIDSIVDIIATSVCLDVLGVDKIFYSLIPLNKIVAPATADLLTGKKVYFTGNVFENVTPTGMAICAALGSQVEADSRVVSLGRSGTGAGSLDPAECANVLRVVEVDRAGRGPTERVTVIEAEIDDMNPQFFEPLYEKVLAQGALDVFLTNIQMKKSRPGFLLTVLSKPQDFDKISRIILNDTTTIGLRCYDTRRLTLDRRVVKVGCFGRRVRVKVVDTPDGRRRVQPEYGDCKALAKALNLSVADVHREAKRKAEDQWLSRV